MTPVDGRQDRLEGNSKRRDRFPLFTGMGLPRGETAVSTTSGLSPGECVRDCAFE